MIDSTLDEVFGAESVSDGCPTLDEVFGADFMVSGQDSLSNLLSGLGIGSIVDSDFCATISQLPQELVDIIAEDFFNYHLCPGKVFVSKRPSHDGVIFRNGRYYRAARPELFQAMDKRWYNKYLDILWSQNAFVIDDIKRVKAIASHLLHRIRRVELEFTLRDEEFRLNHELCSTSNKILANVSDTIINRWGSPTDIDTYRLERSIPKIECTRELRKKWHEKIRQIFIMNIEELRLDFSEAYGPDGLFLGWSLLHSFPFHSGTKDTKILIKAPNRATKRQFLRGVNQFRGFRAY